MGFPRCGISEDLGIDPANEEFTVVGIGDMSGDVFGNGMLLSRHIRLFLARSTIAISSSIPTRIPQPLTPSGRG